jgi:hypothetical protein
VQQVLVVAGEDLQVGRSRRITGISVSQRFMLRTPFFIANTPGCAAISSWCRGCTSPSVASGYWNRMSGSRSPRRSRDSGPAERPSGSRSAASRATGYTRPARRRRRPRACFFRGDLRAFERDAGDDRDAAVGRLDERADHLRLLVCVRNVPSPAWPRTTRL